ncbi:protein O-mannosyl-transferase family [Candidatus Omnitrophota bacterium]
MIKPSDKTRAQKPASLIQINDCLLIAVLLLASFLTYIKTLCPTVYEGDSGELLAAVATLGVAHPTGFPLYILLSRLFTIIIPFGDIAYRVNILSAFFASLSTGVIYLALRTLAINRPVCFASALSFAFSATLWSHATAARVYTLAGFFIALLVWIIFLWNIKQKDKYLFLFAVMLGLALATHAMVILVIPMAIAAIAVTKPRTFLRPAFVLAVFIALALSGLQYFYLPIAASRDPVVNWGNPTNLVSFFNYITQREYAFKMGVRSTAGSLRVLLTAMKLFILDFTPLGLVFILGLIGHWRRHKRIFLLSCLLVIGNLLLMIYYGNEEDLFTLFRYLLPSYIIITIWIGCGLNYFYIYLKTRARLRLAAWLPLILLPLACFVANYHKNDRSKNFIISDYATDVLNTVPKGSILLSTGDAVFGPLLYLQASKGLRGDVTIVDRELITWDWGCESLLKHRGNIMPEDILSVPRQERLHHFIDSNILQTPVFSTFLMLGDYENIPYGLVYKIAPLKSVSDFEDVAQANASLWKGYSQRGLLDRGIHKDYMVKEIVRAYSKGHNNLGLYYSNHGRIDDAIGEYIESLKFNPENFASLFNLGQLYLQKQDNQKARIVLDKARKLNPDFFLSGPAKEMASQTDKYAVILPDITGGEETAQYHIQRGINYGMTGEHDKAIGEFKKALRLDPEYSLAYVNLGNAYMNQGSTEEGIAMYKKAIQINPGIESSIAYLNLGAIYTNIKGDYRLAVEYLQKFVGLNPDSEESKMIEQQIHQLIYMMLQTEEGSD